jgi:hypothetical protein
MTGKVEACDGFANHWRSTMWLRRIDPVPLVMMSIGVLIGTLLIFVA